MERSRDRSGKEEAGKSGGNENSADPSQISERSRDRSGQGPAGKSGGNENS
ncbi:unnamed protein product, partial [Laminaria digitata]